MCFASQGESSLKISARWGLPFRRSQGTNKQSNIETDSLTDWCFYREINISKSKALDAMDCNEDDSGEQESDDIDRTDTPDLHSLLDDTDESNPENLSVNNEDIAAALIRYT